MWPPHGFTSRRAGTRSRGAVKASSEIRRVDPKARHLLMIASEVLPAVPGAARTTKIVSFCISVVSERGDQGSRGGDSEPTPVSDSGYVAEANRQYASAQRRLSAESKQVLELSEREARAMDANHVGTEHICARCRPIIRDAPFIAPVQVALCTRMCRSAACWQVSEAPPASFGTTRRADTRFRPGMTHPCSPSTTR